MMKPISIGKANVLTCLGTYLSLCSIVTIMFFGYSIGFFAVGLPLLILGFVCYVFRFIFLLTTKNIYATKKRAVIELALLLTLIIVSFLFTSVKIVDTATGFTIQQNYDLFFILAYTIYCVATFVVHVLTNQKIGKAGKKEIEKKKSLI